MPAAQDAQDAQDVQDMQEQVLGVASTGLAAAGWFEACIARLTPPRAERVRRSPRRHRGTRRVARVC